MDTTEFKDYLKQLKGLKNILTKESTKTGQIHKRSILVETELLSKQWFSQIKEKLILNGFIDDQLIKYNERFTHLLKLSSSAGNLKNSFLKDLKEVVSTYNDDIILKLHTGHNLPNPLNDVYSSLLADVKDQEQNIYLEEAVDCAKLSFFRAAIVLGWCAAIHQIHKTIEKLGFTQFNIASTKMASARQGRFKRFNKTFVVSTTDDLMEVFDNDVLWVIEGMGLIDLNQHTRLKSCFDMRNHSAHPGEAPITPYNVMSFFSDINEIILKNQKFQ